MLGLSLGVPSLALPDRFFPFLFVVATTNKNGKKRSGNARLGCSLPLQNSIQTCLYDSQGSRTISRNLRCAKIAKLLQVNLTRSALVVRLIVS